MKRCLLALVLALLWVGSLVAGDKELTVQSIFGSGRLGGRSMPGVRWIEGGAKFSYQQLDTTTKSVNLFSYALDDGKRDLLLDVSALRVSPEDPMFRFTSYQWSPGEKQILFVSSPPERQYLSRQTPAGNFYLYDRASKSFRRLTNVSVPQYNQKFSPDGSKIGFVRDNNIYVLDVKTGAETQLTADGNDHVTNGKFDWVYEEEFGISDGWQWSPDGGSIAYWRLDQARIPEFHLMDLMSLRADVTPLHYPKAGDPNSIVKVGVVSLETKQTVWMDLGTNDDIYIPRMQWMPDGKAVAIQKLNRLQNKLEILSGDPASGRTRVFFTEEEKTWIEERYDLRFVGANGEFLWVSERDGYSHIFLFDKTGALVRQLTKGTWDVGGVVGVDDEKKVVFFTAAVKSPLERHLYRISFDGSGMTQLTKDGSSHSANITPDFRNALDTYSNVTTPPKTALIRTDGTPVRMVEENRNDALAEVRLGEQSFFTFTTSDGVTLNGSMIKPPDFDAAKKYPVLFDVYGGPGSQTVMNSWGGATALWHHMMARKGYLIVSVDGRGTGARGKAFKSIVYRKLGTWEVNDQVEAAKFLGTLPFVEKSRIGIWGWSYGGYMAALTLLKGSEVFKSAVAVAPVTDWKFYDTIYSERYMGLPQDNAEGYKESSPITHAAKLKGNLLIVHGTTDDNVHWQNSAQLIDALQKSGKQFQTMFYVNRNHGIGGGNTRVHLFEMITNFITEKL